MTTRFVTPEAMDAFPAPRFNPFPPPALPPPPLPLPSNYARRSRTWNLLALIVVQGYASLFTPRGHDATRVVPRHGVGLDFVRDDRMRQFRSPGVPNAHHAARARHQGWAGPSHAVVLARDG